MLKLGGAALNAGANSGVPAASAYSAPTFAPGLCAIWMAAVAVSIGAVPLVPPLSALLNRLPHAPVDPTHAASAFASLSISACGTAAFPAGVVVAATPVASVARFPAF